MISQNKIKFIKSLEQKKYRKKQGCFVVEGEKMVTELLNSDYTIREIYSTPDFQAKTIKNGITETIIDDKTLNKISQLKTPNKVLAVVELPNPPLLPTQPDDIVLLLDDIQDPGNLGTIIRTAAWYGIKHIVCSTNTVDVYNPKVVQATMGAMFHLQVLYAELSDFLEKKDKKISTFGATLDGNNLYTQKLPTNAFIVMGNESKGISAEIQAKLDETIKLPPFPIDNYNVESLNVSIATALICGEFRRQHTIE